MDSFFGIGIFELFLIAVIALVVLGPERLPGAMRTIAGYFRQIRDISSEFTSQFSDEIKMLEEMDPRRMINDALDPSKTPASSTNTAKAAAKPAATAKPATTKPAATSNAAKSAAAAAAVAKNAAPPLASEENTMLPPQPGDAAQDAASQVATPEVAPENVILPSEDSRPAETAKSTASAGNAESPSANGTAPHPDKPAEPKAVASAEE